MIKAFTIGLLSVSVSCGCSAGAKANATDGGTTGDSTGSCTGTLCQDPSRCVGSDAGTVNVSSSACAAMGDYDPATGVTTITVVLTYDDSSLTSGFQVYLPGFITTGTFTDGTVGPLPASFAAQYPFEHYSLCYRPNLNAYPSWVQAQAQLPDGGQLGSFSLTLTNVRQGQNPGSDLVYFIHGTAHIVCAPQPGVANETATGEVTLDVTF